MPENKTEEPKGFSYYVSDEQLRDYATWPMEKRLDWLMAGLRLRNALPEHIREIQDKFRRGEI